jgi:hypothetical protein
MRKSAPKILFILFAIVLVVNAKAQNNVWNSIKEIDGVMMYWRYRMELRDQYICELKFENNNSYDVSVSFKAHFVCANGHDFLSAQDFTTVKANNKKAGQWDGLSYYPCENATEPPGMGGLRNITIKKVN